LIKVLLMMKKNTIVPHCGIKTRINHKFPTDLEARKVRIASDPTTWERHGTKPRCAFINNFSAAGGNSALLIEDAPLRDRSTQNRDPRSQHLIAVSAKCGVSLQGNLQSMLNFLEDEPAVSLSELSYTTTARRQHHMHRVMICGNDHRDLCHQLRKAVTDQAGMTRAKAAPQLLFTFTGNGAQYPGMGKELYHQFSVFHSEVDQLDGIGQNLGFPSVLPVILSDDTDIGAFTPTLVQLATTYLQIALVRLWESLAIRPALVVGHSLGEYAALNIAGVISDVETIFLVGKRAQLLEEKCTRDTHSMLVVKGSLDDVAEALSEKPYEVACINSHVETVLAGPNIDMSAFQHILGEAGLKSILLKVPYAFHSSQVDCILDDFTKLASGVTYRSPTLPVLCPLYGNIIDAGGVITAEYLARHCREPVNMMGTLLAAQHTGMKVSTFALEIGPHPAVSGMIKATLPTVNTLASLQRGRSALQTVASTIKTLYCAGLHIAWSEYHRDFTAAQKIVDLPAYSWDLKHYWIQYVNDWSLRKGDAPLVISTGSSSLNTTTIHNVVQENVNDRDGHIVVEADIARKDLCPLVQGHEVDGIPLCTPSVYCDMALSLGNYLTTRYRHLQDGTLVDVTDMTISKALILNSQGSKQLLQAHCDVDWSTNSASVRFMSFDSKQKLQEHSRCIIRLAQKSLWSQLKKDAPTVLQKMQRLREGIAKETSARFNGPMVYRAIRPLARFHDDYKAIDEVVLDSNTLEASSKLNFGSIKREGKYHLHPALIDAFTQSCGFTMNCNDNADLDSEVFMNHGWAGFQIFEPISFDKTYTTYSQMYEGKDKLWYGDVHVFDSDKIVAVFSGIAVSYHHHRRAAMITDMYRRYKACLVAFSR
jgi:iterative type I PKS product template protein